MTPTQLAHELIGTCDSRDPQEELGDDSVLLAEFDMLAFCCDCCGWWCDMDEANDAPNGQGFVCDDCKEDDE